MLRRDASVVAVDAATGSDLWSELADGFWVHPGEVVTSRDGALVARTPRSGDTTWTLPPAAFGQLDA